MAQRKKPQKKPPIVPVKSPQYDLFTQFLDNNAASISNTIEIWDSIPKYFLTPQQVETLRNADGLASSYKWTYKYRDIPCSIKIQPALIEQEDGSDKAFFPGVTEELVEEALKKIFTDQRYGSHDPDKAETWVYFSLSMVRRELKARGRERNYTEIKQAIEIMASCVLTFYKDGKELWKGAILQDLVTVGRDEYLENSDAQHVARLPLFISEAINQSDYRQFNYERLMQCNQQLTRWIYKKLIHRFRQAGIITHYHFMYSSLQMESGLLQQKRFNNNSRKVTAALDELVKRGVLSGYQTDIYKSKRKILDIKYTVRAAPDFIKEQKTANGQKLKIQTKKGLFDQSVFKGSWCHLSPC